MINDYPINSSQGDLFRRSEFALRIASLIKNRQDEESIVFGINGSWGSGKTTVLNFISEELKKEYPRIVVIKFNPWRFLDESKLLESFFTTISKDLSSSLNAMEKREGMKDHERKKDLKELADILGDYGEAISEIPLPVTTWLGKFAKVTFKRISATELEEKKKDLSGLISKYKRKIVVVIDDIDRLSKDEVYSIFRLVKLTGDFNHFVYLLAYDEKMVAAAMAERFGKGSSGSGRSFLEKIVQIPVKLPEITYQELNVFFSKKFEEILSENKIVIDVASKLRLQKVFSSTLLFNLDSPRKVVRYCNALQFAMPLMAGEVNFVDLILFEGIKIYFPKHYDFIRDYPHYFIYDSGFNWDQHKDKFREEYAKRINHLSERDKKTIGELLSELFPTLNQVWYNTIYPLETFIKWTKEKRIVSKEYFARYLTYSLTKSEISERAFDVLVGSLKHASSNTVAQLLSDFIGQYEVGSVIQKLRQLEETFSEVESHQIAKGISNLSTRFPKYFGFMGDSFSPFSQAAMFTARLLGNVKAGDRLKIAKELVMSSSTFEFAYEINKWVRTINKKLLYTDEEIQDLGEVLKERCIQESGGTPFFIKFPDSAGYIISIWCKQNKANLVEYLKAVCSQRDKAVKFLESIVGKSYASASGSSDIAEYISDFTQGNLAFLKSTVGTSWLYEILTKEFGEDFELNAILDTKFSTSQSADNIVKQFMYWHRNSYR